jgi:hypothetical protein
VAVDFSVVFHWFGRKLLLLRFFVATKKRAPIRGASKNIASRVLLKVNLYVMILKVTDKSVTQCVRGLGRGRGGVDGGPSAEIAQKNAT